VIATLGAPLEVSAANLAIETFLPMDERSAAWRAQCKGARRMTALPPRLRSHPGNRATDDPAVLEPDRAWSVCPCGPSHCCFARLGAASRVAAALRFSGPSASFWEDERSPTLPLDSHLEPDPRPAIGEGEAAGPRSHGSVRTRHEAHRSWRRRQTSSTVSGARGRGLTRPVGHADATAVPRGNPEGHRSLAGKDHRDLFPER
jgi:hypothetical protein